MFEAGLYKVNNCAEFEICSEAIELVGVDGVTVRDVEASEAGLSE